MVKFIIGLLGASSFFIVVLVGLLTIVFVSLFTSLIIWAGANWLVCPVFGWELISWTQSYVIAIIFGFLDLVFGR